MFCVLAAGGPAGAVGVIVEIGVRAVRAVADPERHAAALRRAEIFDRQARLRRAVHEDLDSAAREDDARMEPRVGIRRRFDRLLELARPLRPQALPRVGGMRDVLDRVCPLLRGAGAEVERPEVHRVERRPVDDVEGDAEEALLGDVLALQVDLDDALAELDPVQDDPPIARPRVEASDGTAFLAGCRERAVEDLPAPSVGQPCKIRSDAVRRLRAAVSRAPEEDCRRKRQPGDAVHGRPRACGRRAHRLEPGRRSSITAASTQ